MKKHFIQSTIFLLIGGVITKLLGMIIKIYMSRIIGLEGLSLYMLVLPTFSLFMMISQAGIPLALSRMVASKKYNNSSLYSTIVLFLFFFNIILMFLLYFFSPYLSFSLLHNKETYLSILSIIFVIPFTTLSSFLRSYFIGKEKMIPPVLSGIVENIIRLLFLLLIVPRLSYSTPLLVSIIILFNIISELSSSIFLYWFLPKESLSFSFQKKYLYDLFPLAIPNISSNLIGNITYFFEPILLMKILLYLGFSQSYISQEYGIITGYVFPLLSLPSFFITSIMQALLPTLTSYYENNNVYKFKKITFLLFLFIFCFSIALFILFLLFGKFFLYYLYHTSYGYSYLILLTFFGFFYYVQPIFSFLYLSINQTKKILMSTIFSSIVRILSLIIFLFLGFGIKAFLLSFLCNVVLTFFYQIYLFLHSF